MKSTEFWIWWFTDEFGDRRMTTYRMSREMAIGRFPDAEPVPGPREMRDVPESMDEWQTARAWKPKD
jgi:hypothetical protein